MPLAPLFLALAFQTSAAPPPPAAKPFVGPPSPYRINASAEVWVFAKLMPDLKPVAEDRPVSLLGQFRARLQARSILPPTLAVDPLQFLPPQRFGGNPLPKSYPLGGPVANW